MTNPDHQLPNVQPDSQSAKLNIMMDASKYDTFLMCPRKYYYRYMLNKHPLETAKPLDRGTLTHLAAETYYALLQKKVTYDNAVPAALSAVRSAGMDTDLDVDEILRVIDVMEEYFDYWRVEDQNWQIVDVEKPFVYLLHESEDWKFYFSGKIDLIISNENYTNLPIDHKSYDRAFPIGRMSNQFKNYVNALESSYLLVNRIGYQKTLKPHEKFLRVPLSYDQLIMEQWKRNVIAVIDHYVMCLVDNYWPQNETSCDKFNRKCEYYDVCDSSGQKAVEFKLMTMFKDGEVWDVTKTLKKTSQLIEEKISGEDGAHSQTPSS
jgi:CRISPR/Cas system-associated exonuclease Cas4 (RecB family)